MKKTTMAVCTIFALIACLFASGTENYGLNSKDAYAWMDGTTAPLECVGKCQANGLDIQKNYTNGVHYVTDECKLVCYGTSTIASTPINGQETSQKVQNLTRNGTLGQKEGQTGRELRMTTEEIAALIKNSSRIDYSGISEAGEIRIRAREMVYQNTTIDAAQKTVYADIDGGKRVEISQQATNVRITDSAKKSVDAYEASITGERLKINGWQVDIMPSEALSAAGAKDGAQITIDANVVAGNANGAPAYAAYYTITERVNAKLFATIGTNYEIKDFVDAQYGNATLGKKPWWAFLAMEEK